MKSVEKKTFSSADEVTAYEFAGMWA